MKSITVLKLKLEPHESLAPLAEMMRRARNAGMDDWYLRQRGQAESPKQSGRLIKRVGAADRPKAESTKIYHAITAAVPDIGTQQAAAIGRQLASHLSARLDWREGVMEDGRRPKRRDAILSYDLPAHKPVFRELEIPLLNNHSRLYWGDTCRLVVLGASRDIGRLELHVSLRRLSAGHKRILRAVAAGEMKASDSRIVQRGDAWYWHLPVRFEAHLRSELVAGLTPTLGEADGQADRPFRLTLPGGRVWHVGDGRYLLGQSERLIGLRKQIGWRYRQRMGAGHGRKKVDAAVRRRVKQLADIRAEVRRRAIADVVRQCERAGCGRLVYREPTGPTKPLCWFARHGLEWDWTRFVGDLKNACARKGIEVVVEKLRRKDAVDGDSTEAA